MKNQPIIHQSGNTIYNIHRINGNVYYSDNEPLEHFLTDIPAPPDHIIGRQQDLTTIAEKLDTHKRLLLVNGIGGMGKTTVAEEYVQQHKAAYDHIVWLRHLSTFPEAVLNSLNLKRFAWQKHEDETLEAFANRILLQLKNTEGNNLLIIDGWDDPQAIHEWQDRLNLPNWQVLITTRSQPTGIQIHHIGQLPKDEALQLFALRYYDDEIQAGSKSLEKDDLLQDLLQEEGNDQLPELLEYISYHTLTIELLAKTLANTPFIDNVNHLLERLKNNEWDDGDLMVDIRTKHSKEEVQVYQHLLNTFNLVNLKDYGQ